MVKLRTRMLRRPLVVLTVLATVLFAAPAANAAPAAAALGSAASNCESTPTFDVSALLLSPYSFRDGSTVVQHRQWRLTDKNYATVSTPIEGTTITLYRSDGKVCGPVRVIRQGSSYYASVGTLSNRGYRIQVCIAYPHHVGKCGAWKKE